MSTEAVRWHALHVSYYDEDKSGLLLDCVRPMFECQRTTASRLYFVPHWLRGPHLRLCFEATTHDFERVVEPAVRDRVGAYLARHPSTTVLEAARLIPLYRHLASAEREPGPLLPLYADNQIRVCAHDRRTAALGSAELADVVENFYVDSNDLAFDMAESIRAGHDRRTLAFELMVAVAHQLSHHLRFGFVSYRSHAEAFLAGSSDPAAMREFLDSQYRARAAALAHEMARVVAVLDAGGSPSAGVSSFVALLRDLRDRVEPEIAAGRLRLPGDGSTLATGPGSETAARSPARMRHIVAYSEFHRALDGDADMRTELYRDPAFQAYRLMINLVYLHLSRLGVRPLERYVVSHSIANTVEATYGVRAIDAMRFARSV
jgi:hypothetical protein